jgi:hypothetical protein
VVRATTYLPGRAFGTTYLISYSHGFYDGEPLYSQNRHQVCILFSANLKNCAISLDSQLIQLFSSWVIMFSTRRSDTAVQFLNFENGVFFTYTAPATQPRLQESSYQQLMEKATVVVYAK